MKEEYLILQYFKEGYNDTIYICDLKHEIGEINDLVFISNLEISESSIILVMHHIAIYKEDYVREFSYEEGLKECARLEETYEAHKFLLMKYSENIKEIIKLAEEIILFKGII